jgi:hypothetical protein
VLTIFILLIVRPFLATALIVGITSQDLLLDLGVLFLILEELRVRLEDVYKSRGTMYGSV